MEAVNFERARISWTTKGGIDGSWRVVATACPRNSADCIYLAPAVMAGHIFGTDRLPLQPAYSYQLIARRDRHAIVREDEISGNRDNEADNASVFSAFDIHAPKCAARSIGIGSLDSDTLARLWPLSVRLNARGQRGEPWTLEFPINHISTRTGPEAAFQIESGPVLIPRDVVEIAGASIAGGCYLAYVFLNKCSQVDVLAWGATGNIHRSFRHFARLSGIETDIVNPQTAG